MNAIQGLSSSTDICGPVLSLGMTNGMVAPAVHVAKPASSDLPALEIHVTEIQDAADLDEWLPAWQRLTEVAVEPNAFYEPSTLIPALRHLQSRKVRVLLAWSTPRVWPSGPRILCGLIPLIAGEETTRWGAKFGLSGQTAWQHAHCYLTTPLIRSDVAVETLSAIWKYAAENLSASWVTLPCTHAEGPFQHALLQFIQESERSFFVRSLHRRALFQRAKSAEHYISQWSRVRRHTIKRLTKKLSEQGEITIRSLKDGHPLEPWIEQFLEMEASGWKGKARSALAFSDRDQAFVREMFETRWKRDELDCISLNVDGIPVAMKCNLLTGSGGFAWKIAYNERFEKFSPGSVLEKATIELLHANDRTQWMDSCAAPNHPMIDGLWPGRRLLQSISIATSRRGAAFGLASLPMLRWLQRTAKTLRTKRKGESSSIEQLSNPPPKESE